MKFVRGDIEEMPFSSNSMDVVVSNCVINLVPDKIKAFAEVHRVLKPGGHFSISDVVLKGELPPELKESAVMYAGCVAGAIEKKKYLSIIRQSGFTNVEVKKNKEIVLPEEILKSYLSDKELEAYRNSDNGIFSITVVGSK